MKKHEQIHLITAQTFVMPMYDLWSLDDFIPCGLNDSVLFRGFEWDKKEECWIDIEGQDVELTDEIYPKVRDRHFALLKEEPRKTGKIKYVGAFTFVSPVKYTSKRKEKIVPCDESQAEFFIVFEWEPTQYWTYWPNTPDENGEDIDLTFFDSKKEASEYALKRHLLLADRYEVTP